MPAPPPISGQKLLSPEQESEWAKIAATQLAWSDRPFSTPGLADYPDAILRRLLVQLPPGTNLHPQVHFYDTAFPDAFVAPGGQIYMSRQIAAYLHSESDLAALLAHELGHALARQDELEFSEAARQLLGIDSLSGRNTVLEVYSQLLDKASSDRKAAREWAEQEAEHEEPDQTLADHSALYLLANAGYPPKAMEQLFERIARSHRKTGSWLTDLLQVTTPDEKRMRALQKSLDEMPASCRNQEPPAPVGNFDAWRASLISADRPTGMESLPSLLGMGHLQPGLAGPVDTIRFSPDGRYLLLHSASGVLVYTTNPLAFQFRIKAPDVTSVGFSADSQAVIFHTSGLRVEQWNIASRKRISLHMAVPLDGCWREMDSPDGRLLADINCAGELSILEESNGATLFSKKNKGGWGTGAFSPDGRYFVVVESGSDSQTAIAVDLKTGKEVSLSQSLGSELSASKDFVFLGPDRLAIYGAFLQPTTIYVASFPAGKIINSVKYSLGTGSTGKRGAADAQEEVTELEGAPREIGTLTKADGDLLLSPFRRYPAVLVDVVHARFVSAFRSPVVDVYGNLYAARVRGRLGIARLGTGQLQAAVDLPPGLLGRVVAAAVSPDLKWLAISGEEEGGVFRLENGAQMDQTQAFSGAWFGESNALYADFSQANGNGSKGPSEGSVVKRIELEKSGPPFQLEAGSGTIQEGRFLLSFRKNRQKSDDGFDLELRTLPENKLLWKRALPLEPATVGFVPGGDLLLFGWPVLPEIHVGLLNRIELTPKVMRRYLGIGQIDSGYAFQVFDANTGELRGKFLLSGNAVWTGWKEAGATDEDVVLSDDSERTLVYSWKTGQREGLALGQALAVSTDGHLVCLALTPRELTLARLPSLAPDSAPTLEFPRTISLVRFSGDGRRLFVLTRDQRYFIFDVSKLERQPLESARQ